MGIMGGTLIQRPALQTVGDNVSQRGILHRTALIDNFLQLLIGIAGEIAAHCTIVKNAGSIIVQYFGRTLIHP